MTWRDIDWKDFQKYFVDWHSKKELQEFFKLSISETRHCFNFLRKLNEFEFRESMGERRRFHQLKLKTL